MTYAICSPSITTPGLVAGPETSGTSAITTRAPQSASIEARRSTGSPGSSET